MQIWLLVTLLLAAFGHIQGDTKILREVNILSDNAYRQETFSLKNENSDAPELVIEGTLTQTIPSKDHPNLVYNIETIYVADKNGNGVIYKISTGPGFVAAAVPAAQLNPSTLKGLGG